jgi:hypothetical protein
MGTFVTPLIVEAIGEGRWRLHEGFIYVIGDYKTGTQLVIPAGFDTDFASIPRVFWNVLPPYGKYGKAAVVHDYLYREQPGTRKDADDVFLEAMGVLGVSKETKNIMYSAVRAFGGSSWDKYAI